MLPVSSHYRPGMSGTMPPIRITYSQWVWPFTVGGFAAALATGTVTLLLLDHAGWSLRALVPRAAGLGVVLVGSLAASLRHQRRKRECLLRDAPPGTLFAGAVRPAGAWSAGVLLVGPDGITFTRDPILSFSDVRLGWSEIASIRWTRRSLYIGVLEVRTTAGRRHVWRQVANAVEPALGHLQQQSASGVDGGGAPRL